MSNPSRLVGPAVAALVFVASAPVAFAPVASASPMYQIQVTCQVPKTQPERQLASNYCINYLPDATQTFVAHVSDGSGSPVAGVQVAWTDSAKSAHFRTRNNPCTTGTDGTCSDELVDLHPRAGKIIKVTATAGNTSAVGYLSFR